MGLELISIHDLSKAIKVSLRTLRTYVKDDTIPHYRLGKLVRFKPAEVEEWLKSKAVNPYDRGVYDPKMEKSPLTARHNG